MPLLVSTVPVAPGLKRAAEKFRQRIKQGDEWRVELTFDGGKKGQSKALAPELPLVIRY